MTMRRFAWWLIALAFLALLGVVYPPFEFHSRAQVELVRAAGQFSARDFVQKFWREHLAASHARAEDANAVLAAIARSPTEAYARHGRTVGIGGNRTFYLRGNGRVVSVGEDEVRLAVVSTGVTADVVIPLGFVFGNAVRDGTDLLDSSAFPNAQQFNEIAAELNAVVESQVLPELKRIAVVGARIAFAGCAEVKEPTDQALPLVLVPLSVQRQEQ